MRRYQLRTRTAIKSGCHCPNHVEDVRFAKTASLLGMRVVQCNLARQAQQPDAAYVLREIPVFPCLTIAGSAQPLELLPPSPHITTLVFRGCVAVQKISKIHTPVLNYSEPGEHPIDKKCCLLFAEEIPLLCQTPTPIPRVYLHCSDFYFVSYEG